jgi:carbonic anhydrase
MDLIYRYDPYRAIHLRQLSSPDEAIRELEAGHGRYARILAQIHDELVGTAPAGPIVIPSDSLSLTFAKTSGAEPIQAPFALVLGCSDARAPVEQIFDLNPNDLFVIRVAGNVLGLECLGSISYAVHKLAKSLQLIVVLGHSNCGAVGAAVDSYIDPNDYSEIAMGHALRSLVDRLHIAVRAAAGEIERLCGFAISNHPGYRAALIEVGVYLNAALTAYDVQRELRLAPETGPRVVYGVFDLVAQRVCALPCRNDLPDHERPPILEKVPESSAGFAELGADLARRVVAKGILGPITA